MSKRTLRRAAERAAQKADRSLLPPQLTAETPKALTATASIHSDYRADYVFKDDPDPRDNPIPIDRASEARLAANRANAQKSTGPVTSEGRATSSLNALKHGLTGNTVLLDSDDAEAYQQRLDAHVQQFKPVTFEERRLVQSIHDAAWRLDRIINLESTIYAKGRIELQFCFDDVPAEQRKSFVQLEIAERNAKQLRNLHLLEGRLQRQRARDIDALKLLIKERLAEETVAAEPGKTAAAPAAPPDLGFVFSTSENAAKTSDHAHPVPLNEAA